MKKLNKLFAILIAVLGVSATAKADTSILKESDGWQKITALPSNLGDYYYVFVDNGQDLMMTLGAGAHQGGEFKTMYYQNSSNPATDLNKVWTLETNTAKGNVSIRNVAYDHLCLQTEWQAAWHFRTHDNGGTATGVNVSWTGFTLAYAAGKWSIQNGNYPDAGYLGPWDNSIVAGAEVACNKTGNAVGYFQVYAISKADFNNLYVAEKSTEGQEVKVDLSFNIGNPTIEGTGALWNSTTGCGCNYTTNKNDGTTGGFLENWSGSGPVGKIYQTLTGLPNGVYELKMKAFRNNNLSGGDAVYVFANSDQTQVTTDNVTTYYTVRTTLTGSTLELGLRQDKAGSQWIGLDEVSLTYLGVDLSELTAVVQATYDELNGLSKEAVPTAFSDEMEELLNKYKTLPNTEDGLTSANNELKDLIATYHLVSGEYTKLQTLIATCESIAENSTETTNGAKATFTTAINSAKTNAASATTTDAIKGVYNTLEKARQTYVKAAEPLNDIKFDYTFMVVNPKFDEGTKGWGFNTTGNPNNGIATNQGGAITGNFFENWKWESYTGEIYQELTGLPSGKYILTAAAFRDQLITDATDGDAVYVFANDKETLVSAATPAFYSVEVSIATGTLRFGVKSKVAKYRWMGIDNVSLQYVEGLGLTEFINAYNAALAAATAARDDEAYSNVAGVEKAALLAAIASQPDQTQLASLESAIAALQSATATFIAAKNSYDLLAVEQQTAKGLGMTNTLIEEIINNKTGLIALQDLKVAEYNYVTSEFSYPVKLSETWNTEGPVGTLYDQHWSGQNSPYLEQSSAAWSSSAWEISYDQDLTLPAGEYVFKVAGRKASGDGCTLSLIVTKGDATLGTVNDFPEGDTGYGIDTNGKTNFSEDGTYANNNAGRAWQWRYVKFTLDSEATVNIAVKAKATTNHQWISFCDATVQMTEETYLEANMGGLDAPTAAANALLGDKKPMGTTEATALQNALNMSVNTGADLLAKIEALEEAIANANEWVTAYNNAKPVLVAALERFEAGYNDAEKGALNHMNKSRWTTAINMAQAAAVAKDVLNSYDGFETAAKNLNDALDEATTSINEYADLKSAIDNANTLANGGNWGEQAFQRPTSAKENLNTKNAQDTYDAAEADGEGVTSVTEALNNGLNGIVLNAPKEGTCYKIVMGDLTWTNNDNATMLSTKDKSLVFVKGGQSEVQGLYSINFIGKNNNYAHALIFNAVKNKINQYTISFIDNDGATRYICDGSVTGAGTGVYGIRTTTDAANALPVEVRATATEGVWNLYNTVAKELLGAQDAGFFTTARNNNLKIMEAPKNEVTLTFSSVGWATLILPFDAELPEGVKAYSCGEANGETLELIEAESIKANTPYLMNGQEGTHDFTGYGLADKDSYTDGLFTGTYVEYKTTANSNTYVLQKKTIDGKDDVAFYLVGENAQPTVGANRCYMTYEAPAGETAAPKFALGRGEGTTSIDKAQLTIDNVVIYDLMGRKVSTMEKGGVYIVNGKKVVIK